jgi:hypothetical protein
MTEQITTGATAPFAPIQIDNRRIRAIIFTSLGNRDWDWNPESRRRRAAMRKAAAFLLLVVRPFMGGAGGGAVRLAGASPVVPTLFVAALPDWNRGRRFAN